MHLRTFMATTALAVVFILCIPPTSTQSPTPTQGANMTGSTMTTPTTMPDTTANATSDTNNETTTTMTTEEPTTTTPTTTTLPPFDLKHNTATATYILELSVGPTNASNIQYKSENATLEEIQEQLRLLFGKEPMLKFNWFYLSPMDGENGTYTLMVKILIGEVGNATDLEMYLKNALSAVNNDFNFTIADQNATDSIIEQFAMATTDICMATDVCPVGFTCNKLGCEHMCRRENCNNHGTCYVTVMADTSAETMCNCDESYDTEYYGNMCQHDRRGRDQIIAIIAGVLGTACLILLIICIVLCILHFRQGSGYDFTTARTAHVNKAYDGTHTAKH